LGYVTALMKYSFLLLAITVSLCIGGNPRDESAKQQTANVRKEHEDKRDQAGKVVACIDTVYRGKERILSTVTITKKTKYGLRLVRAYYAGGREVLDELEYDDGRPQTIRLYKDDVLFDIFKRQSDGSVEPVSSEELEKLKTQQQELIETLKK
jgi:hypothetical protein